MYISKPTGLPFRRQAESTLFSDLTTLHSKIQQILILLEPSCQRCTNIVFKAGLADTNRLHFLRTPPLPEVRAEPCPPAKHQVITDESQFSLVHITLNNNL